jgi:hypothetical protein
MSARLSFDVGAVGEGRTPSRTRVLKDLAGISGLTFGPRLAVILLFSASACSKAMPEATPPADGGTLVTSAPTGSAPTDSGADVATAGMRSSWSGTYVSGAAELYIPPDWKGVRWKVPDSSAGLGEGALRLTIDSKTGLVTGSIDGPLGPAAIAGVSGDGGVSGNVVRQDPSDRGFSGTLVGAVAGDALTGTLNVSAADANAVRKATFALKPSSVARAD